MKALRLSIGFATAGAVLLGGTWAGGAFAELARSGQARAGGAPPYPSAGEVRLGESLEVNGQPMELSLFYTADPPARVIRFYADGFRARGLTPIISREPALAHAAAFDPKSGLQRFINAVAQPDGQTLVMVGATNPRKPPGLQTAADAAPFPVPPGHRAYLGFSGVDPGARSESAQFVSALTQREVELADVHGRRPRPPSFGHRPERVDLGNAQLESLHVVDGVDRLGSGCDMPLAVVRRADDAHRAFGHEHAVHLVHQRRAQHAANVLRIAPYVGRLEDRELWHELSELRRSFVDDLDRSR